MRDLLETGPGAADAGGLVLLTTSASPRLAGYAALAAVGMLAALALGRPAFAALSVPFAVVLGVAVAASPRPELRIGFSLDTARMLEGGTIGGPARRSGRRPGGVDRARARAPRGGHLGRRRRPDSVPARGGGVSTPRLRARLRALGRLPDRARRRAHPERIRAVVDDGAGRCRAAASCLPPARAPAARRAGVRHDPVLRQPGLPRQGGGNRVRRYPPVRGRRPRPPGQLAGERPPRADVRQREPSRARERRDPLPRQLRRGAGVGRRDHRPGRPGGVVARRRVPGAPESRRARQLRRHPPLASPCDGHAPAVPHRRCPHRDRAGSVVFLDDASR